MLTARFFPRLAKLSTSIGPALSKLLLLVLPGNTVAAACAWHLFRPAGHLEVQVLPPVVLPSPAPAALSHPAPSTPKAVPAVVIAVSVVVLVLGFTLAICWKGSFARQQFCAFLTTRNQTVRPVDDMEMQPAEPPPPPAAAAPADDTAVDAAAGNAAGAANDAAAAQGVAWTQRPRATVALITLLAHLRGRVAAAAVAVSSTMLFAATIASLRTSAPLAATLSRLLGEVACYIVAAAAAAASSAAAATARVTSGPAAAGNMGEQHDENATARLVPECCPVCAEPAEEVKTWAGFEGCGHLVCSSCIVRLVRSKLQGAACDAFPLCCFHGLMDDCPGTFTRERLQQLSDSQHAAAGEAGAAAAECEAGAAGGVVSPLTAREIERYEGQCRLARQQQQQDQQQSDQQPEASQQQQRRRRKKWWRRMAGALRDAAAFRMMGSKPCPWCNTQTVHYKDHGCHHIKPGGGCPACHNHWCFNCGRKDHKCRCWSWQKMCYLFCGCPKCPDCMPGSPCPSCDGWCPVCRAGS